MLKYLPFRVVYIYDIIRAKFGNKRYEGAIRLPD